LVACGPGAVGVDAGVAVAVVRGFGVLGLKARPASQAMMMRKTTAAVAARIRILKRSERR